MGNTRCLILCPGKIGDVCMEGVDRIHTWKCVDLNILCIYIHIIKFGQVNFSTIRKNITSLLHLVPS